jgi:hypothetical protein
MIVTTYRDDDSIAEISEGDDVEIVGRFSQGGVSTIAMLGVKIRNVNICGLQLDASIKDDNDDTNPQVRIDNRTVTLKEIDGWGASYNLSTFSNIPACPNQWASVNVYDNPFLARVAIEDRDGRTAETEFHIVPRCVAEFSTTCECICKEGYTLGEVCS